MTVLSGGICALNRLPEILDLGEGEKRKEMRSQFADTGAQAIHCSVKPDEVGSRFDNKRFLLSS
jgi:hypothetical protein